MIGYDIIVNYQFFQVEAYDYSQGFVDMMKVHQERRGLTNLISYQGDSHIQDQLSKNKFDLIFGCNLIDRLHTPITWIEQSKVDISIIYLVHNHHL